jgi:hypothetical protein
MHPETTFTSQPIHTRRVPFRSRSKLKLAIGCRAQRLVARPAASATPPIQAPTLQPNNSR